VRRTKSEFYFFLRTKKHKIMSTKKWKWTLEKIREEEEQVWDEMWKKITKWRKSRDVRNGWKEILQMLREDRFRRYRLLRKAKKETAHIRPLPRELWMGWQMMRERLYINIDLGCSIDKRRKQKLEARLREIDAFIRLLPREHRMWLEGKMDVWKRNDWSLEEFPYDKKMLEAEEKALVASMRILAMATRYNFFTDIREELDERGFEEELKRERRKERVLCGEQIDYLWSIWLAKEWNWYLETKELMLRKTRSKDITGVIMSFC